MHNNFEGSYLMAIQPISYKYVSTKEYIDAFPVAYRQWLDTGGNCSVIHGYAFSIRVFFGSNDLDVRNWVVSYGGLKDLKATLEDQFDHKLLVAENDPHLDWYREAEKRGIARLTILPKLGCEGLADMIYKYINGVFVPDTFGTGEASRIWCYRVEVRETQSNMAFREGHREWEEDLFAD
jgi:6-pyruvoyltetrahydropterin/6-carboxytetrahydropterin synthase